jgi:hypothetical protein
MLESDCFQAYVTEPAAMWVDPAGNGSIPPTSLSEANSAPQARFGHKLTHTVDYRSWLTQTQPRPYLNTINDAGTGREDYDDTTLIERSPALKCY